MSTQEPIGETAAFQLYLWSHRALYIGGSSGNAPHRHHAAQLCIGLDVKLRTREAKDAPWWSERALWIPPDSPHEIDAGAGRIVSVYWEPQSNDYPFTASGSAVRPFCLARDALSVLKSIDADPPCPVEAWARCESALELPAPHRSVPLDPRIADTVEHIRSVPAQPHTLGSLGARVHLSPSRLSHLFSEQVGIALRRFIVWTRVRHVVGHALAGASLTDAAHAAGFADAAHMSHTFRRMFGFAPSVLFAPKVPKRVYLVNEVS